MPARGLRTRPVHWIARRIAIAAVAASTGLLVVVAPSARAVIDGQPDGDQHPNVGLIVGLDSQGHGVYGCTGTLINPTTVLTAAHCVGGEAFSRPVARIVVDFDSHLRQREDGIYFLDNQVEGTGSWDRMFVDFSAIDGASDFYASSAHDVGLLRLVKRADKVFRGIQPMPITGPNTNEIYRSGNSKTLVLQVGYGVQRDGPPGQPGALFVDFTRNQAQVVPKKATDALLFLGANPNDQAGYGLPCEGDSGSPVIRDGTIISLLTFGNNVCSNIAGGPRLDAGPARDWLRSQGVVP